MHSLQHNNGLSAQSAAINSCKHSIIPSSPVKRILTETARYGRNKCCGWKQRSGHVSYCVRHASRNKLSPPQAAVSPRLSFSVSVLQSFLRCSLQTSPSQWCRCASGTPPAQCAALWPPSGQQPSSATCTKPGCVRAHLSSENCSWTLTGRGGAQGSKTGGTFGKWVRPKLQCLDLEDNKVD